MWKLLEVGNKNIAYFSVRQEILLAIVGASVII